jgi:uncharacterized protein (DUF983 family)
MELPRKIGILIVFIIPTFVLSGLLYSWTHSWWLVLGVAVVMIVVYSLIVSGKVRSSTQRT